MDEREFEQGYAHFHRQLNQVLRERDVRRFKVHIARHPGQAGRLSHCLGLSDELAEIEMNKAILIRPALRDLHEDVLKWLKERGIDPPTPRTSRSRRGKKISGKKGR